MTDKKLPFGWICKSAGRGHVDLYDRRGRKIVCLPDSVDLEVFMFRRMEATTGLSREALEMAIWCSENLDTQQPRILFESAEFRVVRIADGESAIIFSDDGKIADAFLGELEDHEGPVNHGVLAATVAMSAINNPDFCGYAMAELDEITVDIEDEQ